MGNPLKERVDREAASRLADAIAAVDASFDAPAFVVEASAPLHGLELKARVGQLTTTLEEYLDGPFERAARVLCAAATGAALDMWAAWPCVTYVERRGLGEPETALDALACLTRYASAEFAIRPFLEHHPQRTLARLAEWTDSGDLHLRRLVSEGTRPRLPWARRLIAPPWDPLVVLPLLDRLHDDPEMYVRRSVANHLNDLTKDHPTLAVMVARRWLAKGGTHVPWVVRHGLRGLVKAGNPDALALVGADPSADVEVYDLRLTEAQVHIGDVLRFSFALRNLADRPVHLVIDYVVHYRRANGSASPRVFKLSTRTVPPLATTLVRRAHSFRPVTTRRYYTGDHRLEIQVNGRVVAGATFQLMG